MCTLDIILWAGALHFYVTYVTLAFVRDTQLPACWHLVVWCCTIFRAPPPGCFPHVRVPQLAGATTQQYGMLGPRITTYRTLCAHSAQLCHVGSAGSVEL